MPIRIRLTLITAVLMAVILAAVCSVLFWRFNEAVTYTFEKGLRSRAQSIVAALGRDDTPLGGEGELIETDESFAQVLTADGDVVDSSAGIERRPLLTRREAARCDGCVSYIERSVRTIEEDTPRTPALLLAVGAPDRRIVVVGASTEDEGETLGELTRDIVVGGSVALLASTLVGWLVAGFALRPVERMRKQAEAISADDGKLLAVPATRDELSRLARTLNDAIVRMRDALERERRFVDDASHELRTPLSVLRTELEVALRRSRSADDLEATVRSATEETQRLQDLAEDLLLLARTGREGLPIRRADFDVGAVLTDVARRHAEAAARRGVSIDVHLPRGLHAVLDASRLRQAMDNLVTNAVRHTPRQGTVTIAASRSNGHIEIVVDDSGPGFPAAFLPQAFDAFTRADEARGRAADDGLGGTGLGLAIVRAIAQAHGGSVDAANRPGGGARLTLRLPDGGPH